MKKFIIEYWYASVLRERLIKAKNKDEAIRKFNKATKKMEVEFVKILEAPYLY